MKKQVSLILAALMVMGGLTACQDEERPVKKDPRAEKNTKNEKIEEDEEEVEESEAVETEDVEETKPSKSGNKVSSNNSGTDKQMVNVSTDRQNITKTPSRNPQSGDKKENKEEDETKETEETEESEEASTVQASDDDEASSETGSKMPDAPTTTGNWEEKMLEDLLVEGGWSIPDDMRLSQSDYKLFKSFADDIGDDEYTAVALIQYQDLEGKDEHNYCYLCKGKDKNKVEYWCLVFAHVTKNNAEFCNVYNIDLQQAFESDMEDTYLPDEKDHQDIWELTNSIEIQSDLMKAYNEAMASEELYNMPYGYLGESDDGTLCFLTGCNLFLCGNESLELTYIAQFDGKTWTVTENSLVDAEAPKCPTRTDIECPYMIYTYGAITVPSALDIDLLPEEVLDILDDKDCTPLAFLSYKEFLHPDNKLLLRVVLCESEDDIVVAYVEEDVKGKLNVASISPLDLESGEIGEDVTGSSEGDWEISETGEIPEVLIEDYNAEVESHGFAHRGMPEYLIATRTVGKDTEYCFLSRQGLMGFGLNDSLEMYRVTLDSKGKQKDINKAYLSFEKYYKVSSSSDMATEDVLNTVYNVVAKEDPDLAEAIMDSKNRKGENSHAIVNGIDLAVFKCDSDRDAKDSWNAYAKEYEDLVVYTDTNYFFFDGMADDDLFGYVFYSGDTVVTIMTDDILQVTTVAGIGDKLAEKLN